MSDGGSTRDGGNESGDRDDDAPGGPPARNGKRRVVTPDEAQTSYTARPTYSEEFRGVDMEIGTTYGDDTISYVDVSPHTPRAVSTAVATKWIVREGIEAGGYDGLLTDDGDADTPLPGYQAETTADYRSADPEDPRGDGVYSRDSADSALTAEIADRVTREGGRIPVDFSAIVQNEGHARSRDWTVYAPAHNPYHVAAGVTDLLRDSEGVSNLQVWVDDDTAADRARRLRGSEFNYSVSDPELIDRAVRELRWASGLSPGQRQALAASPSEARSRLKSADLTDGVIDYQTPLRQIKSHPGDAWDYHEVTISIDEEADTKYWG